jgi:hypothetical protein
VNEWAKPEQTCMFRSSIRPAAHRQWLLRQPGFAPRAGQANASVVAASQPTRQVTSSNLVHWKQGRALMKKPHVLQPAEASRPTASWWQGRERDAVRLVKDLDEGGAASSWDSFRKHFTESTASQEVSYEIASLGRWGGGGGSAKSASQVRCVQPPANQSEQSTWLSRVGSTIHVGESRGNEQPEQVPALDLSQHNE